MSLDFQRLLPVIVSICIIIAVAVLRQYSRTFAAIAATMPINLPLGLWIVYGGENGDPAAMQEFSRSLVINLVPTLCFTVVVWLTFRAGWTLVPAILAGYAAWAVTLALAMLIRTWLGF